MIERKIKFKLEHEGKVTYVWSNPWNDGSIPISKRVYRRIKRELGLPDFKPVIGDKYLVCEFETEPGSTNYMVLEPIKT